MKRKYLAAIFPEIPRCISRNFKVTCVGDQEFVHTFVSERGIPLSGYVWRTWIDILADKL